MKVKTPFIAHPANAVAVIQMLIGKTIDTWGDLATGLEESAFTQGSNAEFDALKDAFVNWHQAPGSEVEAKALLTRYVSLNPESHGGLMNAMSIGHIQAQSWHKNARVFSTPLTPVYPTNKPLAEGIVIRSVSAYKPKFKSSPKPKVKTPPKPALDEMEF